MKEKISPANWNDSEPINGLTSVTQDEKELAKELLRLAEDSHLDTDFYTVLRSQLRNRSRQVSNQNQVRRLDRIVRLPQARMVVRWASNMVILGLLVAFVILSIKLLPSEVKEPGSLQYGQNVYSGDIEKSPLILSKQVCDTSRSESLQPSSVPHLPSHILGGGVVESGDFVFNVWLYCDSALQTSIGDPDLNLVEGLKISTTWNYEGQTINSPIVESSGFGSDLIVHNETTAVLGQGSSSTFTSNVALPKDSPSEPSDNPIPVSFSFKIQTHSGIHGIRLTFQLQRVLEGVRPIDIVAEEITKGAP